MCEDGPVSARISNICSYLTKGRWIIRNLSGRVFLYPLQLNNDCFMGTGNFFRTATGDVEEPPVRGGN